MHTPSPSLRDLVGRLRAVSQNPSDPHAHEAPVVIEKLRVSLTTLAGTEGFTSLLRRALTLAGAEVPSLQSVKVGAEGRLEGLEQLAPETGAGGEAAVAAHLFGLLVTFIGEPLALRLVREAWPDTSLEEHNSRSEAD